MGEQPAFKPRRAPRDALLSLSSTKVNFRIHHSSSTFGSRFHPEIVTDLMVAVT